MDATDNALRQSKPTIHLICNAHLDPVWQWRWEEGCAEALSTFRNAVQLLKEHDDLVFNHNEAILYQWVQKYDSALFKEIQLLVRKGRWAISGGWFLQPDVNMPGTESLIRQILTGRAYFKEYFNVEPKVACNFDSFGHSAGLPQILKLAGYKMYVHMRPQQDRMAIPSDLYRWKGVDGSVMPAYRISVGLYHTEFDNVEQRLREGTEYALKQGRDIGLFWGIGDHGGGATHKDIGTISRFIEHEKRVKLVHSTTDLLCESLEPYLQDAPLVDADLQRVFTGCYTSLSRVKRAAANGLAQIIQTEVLRTALWWLHDVEYPERELNEIWKDHLFNDFHDILPGTCIEPAEQDALGVYQRAEQSARRLRLEAAVSYAQRAAFESAYLPITVLNTNPLLQTVPVEFECMFDYRPPWTGEWHLHLYHPDGTEIPCQEEQPEALLPFHDWRRKISFYAELPAIGAATFRLKPVEEKKSAAESIPAVRHTLSRETGFIEALFYENQQCLTGSLLKPLILADAGDSWGTDEWSFRESAGEVHYLKDSFTVLHSGPIRSTTEAVFEYNKSRFVYHIISYARFPCIEFRIRIHWNEERKHLKLSIPTIYESPNILCEVPGGSTIRPADGEQHVHGRWFIATNGASAIGVVNSGQHGIDFSKGEARLSVLRSAAYCHEQGKVLDDHPYRKFMDQGVHDIQLLVAVGSPSHIKDSMTSYADFLGMPPVAYPHLPLGRIDYEMAEQPAIKDLLIIDDKNIRLLAIYKCPKRDEMCIRLQESTGKETAALIKMDQPSVKMKVSFRPFEIKTITIEKAGRWRETPLC